MSKRGAETVHSDSPLTKRTKMSSGQAPMDVDSVHIDEDLHSRQGGAIGAGMHWLLGFGLLTQSAVWQCCGLRV